MEGQGRTQLSRTGRASGILHTVFLSHLGSVQVGESDIYTEMPCRKKRQGWNQATVNNAAQKPENRKSDLSKG